MHRYLQNLYYLHYGDEIKWSFNVFCMAELYSLIKETLHLIVDIDRLLVNTPKKKEALYKKLLKIMQTMLALNPLKMSIATRRKSYCTFDTIPEEQPPKLLPSEYVARAIGLIALYLSSERDSHREHAKAAYEFLKDTLTLENMKYTGKMNMDDKSAEELLGHGLYTSNENKK